MARIRTVKPELFRHEVLQDLEIKHPGAYSMLVFIALFGHADANGIFPWQPRQLKLDVLPFLSFDMAGTLDILKGAGFIERYEVDGKEYGIIPTFNKHQRLSGKEAANGNKYPLRGKGSDGESPEKHLGSNREIPESQELGSRNMDLGTGKKELGTGKGGPGGNPQSSSLFEKKNHRNENQEPKHYDPLLSDDVFVGTEDALLSINTDDEGYFKITRDQAFSLREQYLHIPNVTEMLQEINRVYNQPPYKYRTKKEAETAVHQYLERADDFNSPITTRFGKKS